MRTSEEIYHRVRWDPRFDPSRFVIGVTLRGRDPARIPLPIFVPHGDIPWHRVLFIEADGEILWDRSTGVDRIDESTAGRVRDPRRLREPFFTPRLTYRWDPMTGWVCDGDRGLQAGPGRRWVASSGQEKPATGLRVLTWNTLWDRYDSNKIHTARRRPLLVDALERADADVIALQEVQRPLLDLLQSARWVRDGYTLSHDSRGGDIEDSGILLLSRLSVREAAWHQLGPYKGVAAITVESHAGPVVVAVTHLTSDHSNGGPARRGDQLRRLATGLAEIDGDLIVMGDFNEEGERPTQILGLWDAWTEIHGPADQTPTFDPRVNPLAALSSLTGRAVRLDRVLLRGNKLRVAVAQLCGDTPTDQDGIFISDHFGVTVELTTVGPRHASAGV